MKEATLKIIRPIICEECDCSAILAVGTSLAQSQANYCDDCWAEALTKKARSAAYNRSAWKLACQLDPTI